MGPEEREDLHLLYQASVADLAFFKSQQWSITNYALLAYAAIVGASELMQAKAPCSIRLALVVSALVVTVSGVVMLRKLQKAIEVRQCRLAFIRNRLTPLFREAWSAMEKGSEYFVVVYVLYPVVLAGGALTIWLVLEGPWST